MEGVIFHSCMNDELRSSVYGHVTAPAMQRWDLRNWRVYYCLLFIEQDRVLYWGSATAPAMRTVKRLITMCGLLVPIAQVATKTVSFDTDVNLLPPSCKMRLRFDEGVSLPPPCERWNLEKCLVFCCLLYYEEWKNIVFGYWFCPRPEGIEIVND